MEMLLCQLLNDALIFVFVSWPLYVLFVFFFPSTWQLASLEVTFHMTNCNMQYSEHIIVQYIVFNTCQVTES